MEDEIAMAESWVAGCPEREGERESLQKQTRKPKSGAAEQPQADAPLDV